MSDGSPIPGRRTPHSFTVVGRALRAPQTVALAGAAVALGIYSWQITVPRFMQLYDSGVYVASALHLVSGVMPYRDFAFVQPPGILLILAPVAAAFHGVSTGAVLLAARILTAAVASANVGLLAWLVRRRGRFAMAVAGLGLALIPVAANVTSSVKIEPYCLLFALLGANSWFGWRGDAARASTRRLVATGVLFGVAAAVEVWAVFPLVALVAVAARDAGRRVVLLLVGAAAGVVALCGPFLALAPHSFVHQVLVDQLLRRSNATTGGQGPWWRLVDATGFAGTHISPPGPVALAALVVLWVSAAFVVRPARRPATAEFFLALSSVAAVAGLILGPDVFLDYGYFAAPFLVGTAAVVASALASSVAARWTESQRSPRASRYARVGTVAIGVVLAAGLVANRCQYFSNFSSLAGATTSGFTTVTRAVPTGDCVVYSNVAVGLIAGRFTSGPGCPAVDDPAGVWEAWGDELRRPALAFVEEWEGYFSGASFVVTQNDVATLPPRVSATSHYADVPWTGALQHWFLSRYRLVASRDGLFVYRQRAALPT